MLPAGADEGLFLMPSLLLFPGRAVPSSVPSCTQENRGTHQAPCYHAFLPRPTASAPRPLWSRRDPWRVSNLLLPLDVQGKQASHAQEISKHKQRSVPPWPWPGGARVVIRLGGAVQEGGEPSWGEELCGPQMGGL